MTLKAEDVRKMCEGKLEDENGRIEILEIGDPLFFPRESPLVNALYKAYVDVTGDTENEPMVIGGGTYAKSLKNIIAFGPEKLGIDYRIHSADEYMLVSGMEEAVLIYKEQLKIFWRFDRKERRNIYERIGCRMDIMKILFRIIMCCKNRREKQW